MRQNFIVDNIVRLEVPSGDEASVFLNPINVVNGLNSVSGGYFGFGNSCFVVQLDFEHDSLFSFDLKISSQSVGASGDFIVGALTYVDSNPQALGYDLTLNPSGLFVPLVIGDTLTCSGRFVVPKLQASSGQNQYLVLGFAGPTDSSVVCTSKFLQCRLHNEDIQVFDPLRN